MNPAPRLDWHHVAAGVIALGLAALAAAEEQELLDDFASRQAVAEVRPLP